MYVRSDGLTTASYNAPVNRLSNTALQCSVLTTRSRPRAVKAVLVTATVIRRCAADHRCLRRL